MKWDIRPPDRAKRDPGVAEYVSTMADEIEGISEELLAYFRRHPAAADTLEGVTGWFLPERGQTHVAIVHAALESLVRRGLIEEVRAAGRTVYRLRRDRLSS